MSKKLQMILLALGLSIVIAFTGCSSDDDDEDEPTVAAPNAPLGVTAVIVAPTVVDLNWTLSALDEAPDGYKIERRTAEGDWSELGTVNDTTTSYSDNTHEMGTGLTYLYRVGAYNAGGTTYSSSATVTMETFTQLLYGFWNALDPENQANVDSVSIIFDYNQSQGGNIFRRTEYSFAFDDSEWIEEGIYTANATAISWTSLRINGVAADTSYTWNYDMATSGQTMTVEFDWGNGPEEVDFIFVPPPPID